MNMSKSIFIIFLIFLAFSFSFLNSLLISLNNAKQINYYTYTSPGIGPTHEELWQIKEFSQNKRIFLREFKPKAAELYKLLVSEEKTSHELYKELEERQKIDNLYLEGENKGYIGNITKIMLSPEEFDINCGERNCTKEEIYNKSLELVYEKSPLNLISLSMMIFLIENINNTNSPIDRIDGYFSQFLGIASLTSRTLFYSSSFTTNAKGFLNKCYKSNTCKDLEYKECHIFCNKKLFEIFENMSESTSSSVKDRNYKNCSKFLPLQVESNRIKNIENSKNPFLNILINIEKNSTEVCLEKTEKYLEENFSSSICIKPLTPNLYIKSMSNTISADLVLIKCLTDRSRSQFYEIKGDFFNESRMEKYL